MNKQSRCISKINLTISEIEIRQKILKDQNEQLKAFQTQSLISICGALKILNAQLKQKNQSQPRVIIQQKQKFYAFLSLASIFFAALYFGNQDVCSPQLGIIFDPIFMLQKQFSDNNEVITVKELLDGLVE
eukprot:EST46821.1 Hypothetical protein SS50377_13151 [Spironucleus salmonicida]